MHEGIKVNGKTLKRSTSRVIYSVKDLLKEMMSMKTTYEYLKHLDDQAAFRETRRANHPFGNELHRIDECIHSLDYHSKFIKTAVENIPEKYQMGDSTLEVVPYPFGPSVATLKYYQENLEKAIEIYPKLLSMEETYVEMLFGVGGFFNKIITLEDFDKYNRLDRIIVPIVQFIPKHGIQISKLIQMRNFLSLHLDHVKFLLKAGEIYDDVLEIRNEMLQLYSPSVEGYSELNSQFRLSIEDLTMAIDLINAILEDHSSVSVTITKVTYYWE